MKKIMTNTAVSKAFLLALTLLSQVTVFAADGTQGDESRWQVVSRMPQFWIGLVLFITFLTAGLMSGRNRKQEAL